jgi:putative nucleotidyltransferase with HDIG domain
MQLLERLGLSPKRPRPSSVKNKRQKTKEEAPLNLWARQRWEKVLFLLGLIALTVWAFPERESHQWGDIRVGEVWRRSDVIAQEDVAIYRSKTELDAERKKVLADIEPIFLANSDPNTQFTNRLDSLSLKLQKTFEAFGRWELARSRGQDNVASDSSRYMKLKHTLPLTLTDLQWSYLLESAKANISGLSATSRASSGNDALDNSLVYQLKTLQPQLNFQNVINAKTDTLKTPYIVVRSEKMHTEMPFAVNKLVGQDKVEAKIKNLLTEKFTTGLDTVAIGMAFFRAAFVPNFVFDQEDTQAQWNAALRSVSETRGFIQKDEVIVRQGEIISDDILSRLKSIEHKWASNQDGLQPWKHILGEILAALTVFSIFILYLFLFRKVIFERNRHLLLIVLLFAIFITAFGVNVRLNFSELLIPTTILSILLAISFDSRVGLFGTVTLACLGGMIFHFGFEIMFHILFSGMIAVYSVRDIRNRGQFVTTAGLVLLTNLVVALIFYLLQISTQDDMIRSLLYIGVNAVLTLMVYPLIWIVERAFDVTTDLTLLELLDTNHALLKDLSMRAPGTFSHSLQVANLAEAACAAVGGNTLLMRVGALYHDVGKMVKPEYFVENQQLGMNPMDALTPRMGALVIVNHIKEGLLLADEHKLPPIVRDFIPMHHGTMRIEYFYRKALAEQKEGDPELLESDFRYQGPNPSTLETGILMLADGVEAACKSLEKPTLRRLEATIDKIFQARIADNQLQDCPITFFDLTKIKEAFLSVLGGMYHFRVKYPGQEEETKEVGARAREVVTKQELGAGKNPFLENDTKEIVLTQKEKIPQKARPEDSEILTPEHTPSLLDVVEAPKEISNVDSPIVEPSTEERSALD